jgi:hypothetical protein
MALPAAHTVVAPPALNLIAAHRWPLPIRILAGTASACRLQRTGTGLAVTLKSRSGRDPGARVPTQAVLEQDRRLSRGIMPADGPGHPLAPAFFLCWASVAGGSMSPGVEVYGTSHTAARRLHRSL